MSFVNTHIHLSTSGFSFVCFVLFSVGFTYGQETAEHGGRQIKLAPGFGSDSGSQLREPAMGGGNQTAIDRYPRGHEPSAFRPGPRSEGDPDGPLFINTDSAPALPEGSEMIPSRDGWVYGTLKAQDLVLQARQFDPEYVADGRRDRDKAIDLYAKSIDAQPGAVLNAVLANRIAQMYAFFEDRKSGVRAEPAKAAEWWEKCLGYSDRTQLLWAQAQMGLASSGVMQSNLDSSLGRIETILELNPESIQLDNWKQTSFAVQPEWHESEILRLQQELRDLQNSARKNTEYLNKVKTSRTRIASARNARSQGGGTNILLWLNVLGGVGLLLFFVFRSRKAKLT